MANLKRQASRQARAEYQPQKRQVKRGLKGELGSLNTMEDALQGSLNTARKQARKSGLNPDDLQTVLVELARSQADVSGGVQLQKRSARSDAMTELADLSASQGAASRSLLDQALSAREERRQEIADRRYEEAQGLREDLRDYELDIKKEKELHALGLTGGLTPSQKKERRESKQNAKFWARQFVQAARKGIVDEKTGELVVPTEVSKWDDSIWSGLVAKVAKEEGVDNTRDAQTAVEEVRDHFKQPSILDSLKTLALGAAPAAASIGLDLLNLDGGGGSRRRR